MANIFCEDETNPPSAPRATTPSWVATASPHAVITRDELLQWLNIGGSDLRPLIEKQGFPPARFGVRVSTGRITKTSRWRVGDVRAWLGRGDVEKEVAKPVGSPGAAKFNAPAWGRNC